MDFFSVSANAMGAEVVCCLAKYGVDVNVVRNHAGKSPLHVAVIKNNVEVVRALVEECHASYMFAPWVGCSITNHETSDNLNIK